MELQNRTLQHIKAVAKVPSFSSFEERLHPYVHGVFGDIPNATAVETPGNNIIYYIKGTGSITLALSAHLDKINHYGSDHPKELPVQSTATFIEGAMDDSAGVGILLALAELSEHLEFPNLLFLFSEMEESKGLKEHPELLKNNGKGYESGMGARQIAKQCLELELIPDEVITIDTTPLFKGDSGIALYSKHWELNGLEPSAELVNKTEAVEDRFKAFNDNIRLDNNTNDYLHYGKIFNQPGEQVVPSVALEPSIFPYHQKGEKVYLKDINKVLNILGSYLSNKVG